MPLDNSDSVLDAREAERAMGLAPDSSALRVSTNTQLESGIPPASEDNEADLALLVSDDELTLDDGVDRLDCALERVGQTEANLGLLSRAFKQLCAAASRTRVANNELMSELEQLRTHLTRSYATEHAQRVRAGQLEQLLDVLRRDSAREREFLIEQQDLFLVQVLTDHERQRERLEAQVRSAATASVDPELVLELRQQRDLAREYATRCERERDLAWQELARTAGPSSVSAETVRRRSTPPPLPATPAAEPVHLNDTAATPLAAIQLRSVSVSAPGSNGPDTERSLAAATTGYAVSRDEARD